MRNKKIILVIIAIILIITITPIIAQNIQEQNSITDIVDSFKSSMDSDDDFQPKYNTNVTKEIYGYDQLKEEIANSNDPDTTYIYNLHEGNYNITDMIICGKPLIKNEYVINGNNQIIDGQNSHQFMKLYSNLKVKDLTLQNTHYEENTTSAITMETISELEIRNCDFNNNYGNTKGSAITNRGICTVVNSNFRENTVEENGGAIWSTGEYGGKLSISDSSFIKNKANQEENNERTAIIYMVSYGNNTIENNEFIENNGRCIHAYNQTNTLIKDNKFTDNTLSDDSIIRGGLIDNYEADITITGNEFVNDNTVGELRGGILYHEIGKLEFSDNTVQCRNENPDPTSNSECNKGGIIYNRNASGIIENNTFENVIVSNYTRGGCIYNNLGELTLINNNFSNSVTGEHIRGLIAFNDVNSVINIANNTLDSRLNGTHETDRKEDIYIFNSKVKNDEGNGTIGQTKNI